MTLTRPIPRTGETLPAVGLGTWQTFDVSRDQYPSRVAVLRRFAEHGGRVVDTSPMYGRSERVLGEMLSALHLADRLFIATKVWTRGASEGAAQIEESFRTLGVRAIDLLQVHNLVDVEAHLRTLAALKAEGRVRYIGVTHYTSDAHRQLEAYVRRPEIDFVQLNYSLAERGAEDRLLPAAAEHGVAVIVNRPFAEGVLLRRVEHEPLPAWASEIKCQTWPQIFLKFILSHPAVTTVVPATSDFEHLEDNMAAGLSPLPDARLRGRMAVWWDEARV